MKLHTVLLVAVVTMSSQHVNAAPMRDCNLNVDAVNRAAATCWSFVNRFGSEMFYTEECIEVAHYVNTASRMLGDFDKIPCKELVYLQETVGDLRKMWRGDK